ncbi:hypothetical protein N7517_006998 [Penicillium concentricum]|uniref:Uncharacterized protein n=1 Tax=Penicillium concentricum TaxID=293559 RepID=A0A9W9SAB7_9EURO|nr:uncharacterized protein N7517_006998 [Penicillium concentricum]KAJ5374992.1 hypothetical protein N7517_006998 [Penicillium concentricum]
MPPVWSSWQEKLQHECSSFRYNLDAQAHILQHDPDRRGKERHTDISRAVVKLTGQADGIIDIALRTVTEAPDSDIIRRNTTFWCREEDGRYKFENVFLGMEHDLINIVLALKKDPCQCECNRMGARLDRIARKAKKKSLPRGIEPRSPALIGINDKRKSSPLDQGRCSRVTARPLEWLMERQAILIL